MRAMFLGLRTVIYPAPDLDASKAWFTKLTGVEPYFDEPFYVGFEVGGYELGLDPDPSEGSSGPGGSVAYWGVDAIGPAFGEGSCERHLDRAPPQREHQDRSHPGPVARRFASVVLLGRGPAASRAAGVPPTVRRSARSSASRREPSGPA